MFSFVVKIGNRPFAVFSVVCCGADNIALPNRPYSKYKIFSSIVRLFLFKGKVELIIITKTSHLDSL